MQRRTVAGLLAASILASATCGWIASTSIHSPAEEAARTAAPEASPILVPAEERVLASEVVTRGTARFGAPQQLSLTTSALKAASPIVSTLPTLGQELVEGNVVLLQSGRPVFLVAGSLPTYRDLGPGLEGDDVRQLQEALLRLGFDPGPITGVYDGATEAAVAAWYRANGFEPFVASADQLAAIAAREVELLGSRIDLLGASDAFALAGADATISQANRDAAALVAARAPATVAAAEAEERAMIAAAEAAVRAREAALAEVRSPTAPTAAEIAQANAEVTAARADAMATDRAGRAEIAAATAARDRAPGILSRARTNLEAVIDLATVEIDAAQQADDEVNADPSSTSAARAAAAAALARAEFDAGIAIAAAQAAVDEAVAAAAAAPGALDAARAAATEANAAAADRLAAAQAVLDGLRAGPPAPTPAAVAAAEAELATARSALATAHRTALTVTAEVNTAASRANADLIAAEATARASATVRGNAAAVVSARNRLTSLAADGLGTARRQAGVQVPADELISVPAAPIRVSELLITPGNPVLGPVLVATNAAVAVDGGLPVEEAGLVTPGMVVQIDEPALGIAATGVVSQVSATPGTGGVDGFHVYFEVLVDGNPPTLPGASVRLTVPVESSGGAALVVPIGAVRLAADGTSRVRVDRDGALVEVTVEPGLAADGFVMVRPMGGSLAAGDLVEVGQESPAGHDRAADAPGTTTSAANPGG